MVRMSMCYHCCMSARVTVSRALTILTMCMCAVGVEEGATTTTRLNTLWRSVALHCALAACQRHTHWPGLAEPLAAKSSDSSCSAPGLWSTSLPCMGEQPAPLASSSQPLSSLWLLTALQASSARYWLCCQEFSSQPEIQICSGHLAGDSCNSRCLLAALLQMADAWIVGIFGFERGSENLTGLRSPPSGSS